MTRIYWTKRFLKIWVADIILLNYNFKLISSVSFKIGHLLRISLGDSMNNANIFDYPENIVVCAAILDARHS